MNRGQLNGFALNGQVADPVVRVRVDAKGYAVGRAQGRVLAYAVVASKPCAHQAGIGGRVEAHMSVEAMARAAVAGILGKVEIHGLLAATGRAIISVTLPPVYGRVRSKAKARGTVSGRVRVRSPLQSVAQVVEGVTPRLMRRAPVRSKPKAAIAADGQIYIRRWLRAPVHGNAVAYIVSTSRIEARLAALTKARALVAANGHTMRRAPVSGQGIALIEIDAEIHKRLPFDEPAPDSRTFRVPEAMNTFYVTDQGTSMFRVSPPMQPADTQDFDIEFDGWFPPGDEIVGVQLKVAPAMPMPPSYAIAAQRVKVWVYAGGTSGEKYKISVTATTNDGRVKEVELIVPIKEV